MNTLEKADRLTLKMLKKQMQKEIRSENSIIFNFANIGNVWASKETELIIHIAFFCSKFMQCLEFRFLTPCSTNTYERWE